MNDNNALDQSLSEDDSVSSSLCGPNMIYKIYNPQESKLKHRRGSSNDISNVETKKKQSEETNKIDLKKDNNSNPTIDEMIANLDKLMKQIDLEKK
jgi:hypothetical protein